MASHLFWISTWCDERKGHIRCEGCHQFYCLSCMNKHHAELVVQFGLLLDAQRNVKESLNAVEVTWERTGELPCFCPIDRWEQEGIQRIQQIAQQARTTANEIMAKNVLDIGQRLDRIGLALEECRKEENYLDNDILLIKNQLEQINHSICHIHESIRVDDSMSNDVDWSAMLNVTLAKNFGKDRGHSLGLTAEYPSEQQNLWSNFRRRMRSRHSTYDYKKKQASFNRDTSLLSEPATLTSFTPTSDRSAQSNSLSASESPVFQRSAKPIHLRSVDHDQPFHSTSDA